MCVCAEPEKILHKNPDYFVQTGNHDYRGSVKAQLNYNSDSRWKMPDLWYPIPNLDQTS